MEYEANIVELDRSGMQESNKVMEGGGFTGHGTLLGRYI